VNVSKSSDPERLNNICVANVSDHLQLQSAYKKTNFKNVIHVRHYQVGWDKHEIRNCDRM
jgi:hypothetical protein